MFWGMKTFTVSVYHKLEREKGRGLERSKSITDLGSSIQPVCYIQKGILQQQEMLVELMDIFVGVIHFL